MKKEDKPKKLNLDLEGINGNAYALLSYFKKNARANGWPEKQIKEVIDDATSSNYDHLIQVLLKA